MYRPTLLQQNDRKEHSMFEELSNFKLRIPRKGRTLTGGERREARYGLSFISLWIVGFLAFTRIPLIATLIFTFVDLIITNDILTPLNIVGVQNYETLFKDSQVSNSLG